jgi:hypothetical protein
MIDTGVTRTSKDEVRSASWHASAEEYAEADSDISSTLLAGMRFATEDI